MTYQPKLSHAIFTGLLSILFAYLWAFVTEKVATVMVFAAFLFFVMTGAIVLSLIEGAHYYSVTAYIEALVKMDSGLRNALAFNVPSLRLIAKRGQVQTLFDDTRVPVKYLHLFLQESKKTLGGVNTTPSKRSWTTSDRPAWAWQEIYDWLNRKNYVRDFATGQDSFEYVGSSYQQLSIYFLSHSIKDLGSPMAYASETDEVEIDK